MKYNIGDEVTVEMMGKITKIECTYGQRLYYTVDATPKYSYARVLESEIYPLIKPEDIKENV